MNCPQCRSAVQAGAAFCDNCGASLAGVAPSAPAWVPPAAAGGPVCPQCRAAVIPGEAFCDACGADLSTVPIGQGVSHPPAAPPPTVTPSATPPVVAGGTRCPTCGTPGTPGQAFCDNCGASLSIPGAVQPPTFPPPPPQPPLVAARARLVLVSNGTQFDCAGKSEILIGREDPVSGIFPDVDLSTHGGEDGGVSRRHAKLTNRGNQWVVEDLNTTNYTFVNKQRLQPGAPQPVSNGDEIRVGKVVLTFQLF